MKMQKRINCVVITIIAIIISVLFAYRYLMLEQSGITVCKVIEKSLKPGTGIVRGEQAIVEYYANGKLYKSIEWNSSNSYMVGDCFKLEYSIKNPQISKVLWSEGKQFCISE